MNRNSAVAETQHGQASVEGAQSCEPGLPVRDNQQLLNQIAELNRELDEFRASKLRDERLTALGQLSASLSHELRNPLGALRTSIFIVKRRLPDADESVLSILERANRSVTRCENIITDMLDFARCSELSAETGEIDRWLHDLLSEQELNSGVTLKRFIDTDDTKVAYDGERLRRAVINIVENALHAVEQAMKLDPDRTENVIAVATKVSGGRLEICVSDTGTGIEDETLEKMFEPLFSTKSFGNGLGMPIVQQIMELHGGGIEIVSALGEGTHVTLWLPLPGVQTPGEDGDET